MQPAFVVGWLMVVALAGCVQDPEPADDGWTAQPGYTEPDGDADWIPHGADHDHTDASAHRLAWNADLLDTMGLREWGWHEELVVGAHAVARHGDLLAVAVNADGIQADDAQNGFHLIDASDPANLHHLAYWDAGAFVFGDRTIEFSPDGNTVFLGQEPTSSAGIAAVDVSNPAAPTLRHFWEEPVSNVPRPPLITPGFNGPHTLETAQIGGETYVFSLVYGVTILRYDETDGFSFVSRYLTADDAALVETYKFLEPGALPDYEQATFDARRYLGHSLYAHDMTFFHDEITGKDLLLVAYAYDGAKILDISDPRLPLLQARWTPDPDSERRHYVHGFTAERMPDGRLLMVVGAESVGVENDALPTPIWVIDGSDAVVGLPLQQTPTMVAKWSNPGGVPAGGLGLSAHWVDQQAGFAYMAHYHGGVWAFDLRGLQPGDTLQHVAFLSPVPAEPVAAPEELSGPDNFDAVPMIYDLEVGQEPGIIYVADLSQGLSSVRMHMPE